MVYSMTGYGEASREMSHKTYRIEIKSLNGKQTEIRFKSNANLREKELALRKIITDLGRRGKFDVSLTMTSQGEDDCKINKSLMQNYYSDLKDFADSNNINTGDVLQTIVRLPNVVQMGDDVLAPEEWTLISDMTKDAMNNLNVFRKTEGESLFKDLEQSVQNIQKALSKVPQYESARIETIKTRIKKNLNQHMAEEKMDHNRFEQELLYYIEKLDINEEKVRLTQHCSFFLDELKKEVFQKGKKLNFIGQEMGREINTLGAKAQHPEIQQLVVKMKDQLEKVKEQILNTL